ncbi:MAG: FkbM family methyltransferase [Verrucomicrobiales bacterium]
MLKRLIQSFLLRFGYYLKSSRRFGEDHWQDLVTLAASPKPGRDRVIFDVGAHQGQTLAAAGRYFPEAAIHCFEPDPSSVEILRAAAAARPKARIHAFALGAAPGSADFHRNRESMTNSLLPTSIGGLSGEYGVLSATDEVIQVPVRTLDEFCEEQGIAFIDLLKTDCQGYDLKVLEGGERMLANHTIGVITCEVIFDDEYEGQGRYHELMAFLDARGYRFMGFQNMARNAALECTFCDAVFRRPPSAS